MRRWTKRDCFVLMDADTPEFWNSPQLSASYQVYRNGPEARAFLESMLNAMSDPRILTDLPNTMGLDNLEGFVEHRHDQSVLSILAQKHDLPRWPDPSQYGNYGTNGESAARVSGKVTEGRVALKGPLFYHHRVRFKYRYFAARLLRAVVVQILSLLPLPVVASLRVLAASLRALRGGWSR